MLAIEFALILGIASWGALKRKYVPWPPAFIRSAAAFSVLAVVAMASEEFAALLGAGFILANLVKMYGGGVAYVGALPKDYAQNAWLLNFGATKTTAPPATTPPGASPLNPVNPGPGLPPARPIV